MPVAYLYYYHIEPTKCRIVGVNRPSVIWCINLWRGASTTRAGTGKYHRLRVAEMVDPHIYGEAARVTWMERMRHHCLRTASFTFLQETAS